MAIQAQLYPENYGFSLDFFVEKENACGFDDVCLIPPQPEQQFWPLEQFQNFSRQNYQNMFVDDDIQSHNQQSVAFPQSASAYIDKQRLEFEQFINLQKERLRTAMEEQGNKQAALLMKKYEWRTRALLKQKEEEIAKAAQRTMELQNFLERMETERQTWQRVAKENEAMVASLNGTIQRLRESVRLSAEDAESCCQNTEEKGQMMCKCCNSRSSCVVILPCRHLCSCTECEVFLDACPVCALEKKSSIQALL